MNFIAIKRFFYITFILFFLAFAQSACSSSRDQADGANQNNKKEKKPKKCKYDACHVRMTHYHEGAKYKGKRGGFFTTLFAPKEPKYGQAVPKRRRK
ncbi:MAG: hypothetical protein JJT94_03790 [Bernardetiaceae bacterium]|nr:hypothetical protein [Bernardetiaceae bacterium]